MRTGLGLPSTLLQVRLVALANKWLDRLMATGTSFCLQPRSESENKLGEKEKKKASLLRAEFVLGLTGLPH